ncbi:MAG: ATP-binding protein [Janthinobacterium lividum]
MTTDPQGSDINPADLHHHTSDGRNVIASDQGHEGRDVFFAAVQMSRMPMILTDPHRTDDPIVFCNRAFERLTGYSQDEILGRNCRFLQGADTDQDTIARIRAGIARQEDVHEEVFNYRKDGSGFWNALFISPVFDPRGNLIYFFASQLDVTRRHEAEAVVQQAQRLETLGSMASGVAHEFNNLMTVVLGSLSQIERGMQDGSRDRQRLDRAKWAANQAGRLTQQMLSFARRQFHDNQTVDLNAILSGFDDIMRQMAGPAVELTLDLVPQPLMVEVDSGQMEMALLNLVRNAADAMPQGGSLVIQTRLEETPDSVMAAVTVKDQGTGMSAEVLQRAIEPFYTTKPKGAGTGLGLSMVNGFAAQSGGRMMIESQPGQGTVIDLQFPLQVVDAAA